MTTPLVRSLVPLADETLPGFLLRLAHRLELTPARLAQRAGLHHNGPATAQSLLSLDDERTVRFAEFARLEPDQVRELLLCRYASHYPPLRLTESTSPSPLKRLPRRGAILTENSRYCPECLAGDGSEIQLRHGGAWRQAWRLQVVFACLLHRRLLEHRCPGCGIAAFRGKSAKPVIALIPEMKLPVGHPALCRSSRCGTRLDSPETPPPGPATQAALELQARILERLDPRGPVPAGDAAQYFALLLLTFNMVMLSWPTAREQIGPDALRDAADAHVDAARAKFDSAILNPGSSGIINAPMRQLPHESTATAGLLLTADKILGWPQLYRLPERLEPLIELASARPQAWYPLRTSPHWPAVVRRALLPQVKGFAIPTRTSSIAPVPARECRFGPEHVPQCLPDAWWQAHLGNLTGISPLQFRRAAALYLVEQSSGLAWSQAAELLRIPHTLAKIAVDRTRIWMRDKQNQHDFEHALEQLAQELDAADPRINYAARRSALLEWEIPDDHWGVLLQQLEAGATHGYGQQSAQHGRRRAMTSVLIWTFVTSSEYGFAPSVLADKAANPASRSRLANAVYKILAAPDTTYYRALKAIITNYATTLAEQIDQTTAAHAFTWTPSSSPRRLIHRRDTNGSNS